jgi:uncharacterized protein YndB with AHSA1/START domain
MIKTNRVKIEIEFPINASSHMLFQYFSLASGLDEWFADHVNSRGEIYTFIWGDSEEQARVLKYDTNEYMRYQWVKDTGTECFFEFRIQVDELTNDISLIVIDFAEPDEVEETKMFWENQINELKKTIGAS